MDRKAQIAAILAGPGDDAEKLKQMTALAEQPAAAAPKAEEKKDEDAKKAEDDKKKDENKKAEDDKKKEDEKTAAAPAAAGDGFAVLDLPEARGRVQLANQQARLVASGKITVEDAKATLAAAPKATRLGDAMQGRDKNPGADAPKAGSGAGLKAAVDRLIEGAKTN